MINTQPSRTELPEGQREQSRRRAAGGASMRRHSLRSGSPALLAAAGARDNLHPSTSAQTLGRVLRPRPLCLRCSAPHRRRAAPARLRPAVGSCTPVLLLLRSTSTWHDSSKICFLDVPPLKASIFNEVCYPLCSAFCAQWRQIKRKPSQPTYQRSDGGWNGRRDIRPQGTRQSRSST